MEIKLRLRGFVDVVNKIGQVTWRLEIDFPLMLVHNLSVSPSAMMVNQ